MSTRNLNKVMLIGNLTRDPELRYTPQGNAVASFTIATNREWAVNGEKKQAADFHSCVAWNKLAEICGQLLKRGTKVFVEGRLQTRSWQDANSGEKKYKTEVVVDDMIILTAKQGGGEMGEEGQEAPMEEPQTTPAAVTGEVNLDDLDFDLDSADAGKADKSDKKKK
jgi:single-strand DNA-binding protein